MSRFEIGPATLLVQDHNGRELQVTDMFLQPARENREGHRLGVAAGREKRRSGVIDSTRRRMSRLDAAGGIANDNILLHARAARSVIDSLNAAAEIIDDFYAPLGIESDRGPLDAIPWREAMRGPQQRQTAAKGAG